MASTVATGRFSNLELTATDSTANAPERDLSANAPEIVPPGLEVKPIQEPLIPDDRASQRATSTTQLNSKHRKPKKLVWTIIILALCLLAAVGLGTGLGITAKKSHDTASSSAASPSSIPVQSTQSSSSLLPSVSSTISVHDILDDTSFAVAATSDGNRHVIFQDISGAIRDSFYSHTTSSWTSTSSWVVPGNARNHTPFSAIVQSFANSSQEGIHLFYINNDNQLALSLFASGTWLSNRTTDYDVGNLGAFTAISSSRALTATPISHAPNMTSNAIDAFRVCLLYESHDGGNEVLLGTQVDRGYSYVTEEAQLSWSWQDITSGLTSEGFGADLTSPFGVSHELFGDASGALEVYGPFAPFQLYAFDQSQNNFSMLQFFPNNNTFSEANDRNGLDMLLGFQPLDPAPSPNETAIIRASDFFVPENGPSFGLWVKEGKLIMLPYGGSLMVPSGGPQEAPVSPFPFTRFAAVNITSFFLYHQINASCFAEEIWDSEALNWVSSTNISVSVWDQGE